MIISGLDVSCHYFVESLPASAQAQKLTIFRADIVQLLLPLGTVIDTRRVGADWHQVYDMRPAFSWARCLPVGKAVFQQIGSHALDI